MILHRDNEGKNITRLENSAVSVPLADAVSLDNHLFGSLSRTFAAGKKPLKPFSDSRNNFPTERAENFAAAFRNEAARRTSGTGGGGVVKRDGSSARRRGMKNRSGELCG